MQVVIDKLLGAAQEGLSTIICLFLQTIFSDVNNQIGTIGNIVAETPASWNTEIFNMMVSVCNAAIVPIANLMLGCIFCYEIVAAIIDNNNLHDTNIMEVIYKSLIKLAIAIPIVTHVYDITMGIFELGAWTVRQSVGAINDSTNIDIGLSIDTIKANLLEMETSWLTIGYLVILVITAFIVSWALKAIYIVINVVVIGRMIEIYMYCCLGPIPFTSILNKDMSSMGQNYIKSIVALALQGLLMMLCVGIYAALVQGLTISDAELEMGLLKILLMSIVLCFSLIKTGSVAKSILNAH